VKRQIGLQSVEGEFQNPLTIGFKRHLTAEIGEVQAPRDDA
jgi:hypothetical protein